MLVPLLREEEVAVEELVVVVLVLVPVLLVTAVDQLLKGQLRVTHWLAVERKVVPLEGMLEQTPNTVAAVAVGQTPQEPQEPLEAVPFMVLVLGEVVVDITPPVVLEEHGVHTQSVEVGLVEPVTGMESRHLTVILDAVMVVVVVPVVLAAAMAVMAHFLAVEAAAEQEQILEMAGSEEMEQMGR